MLQCKFFIFSLVTSGYPLYNNIMKNKHFYQKIIITLGLALALIACKRANPIIIVKPEPFYKEVCDDDFNEVEVYDYLIFEDGNGKSVEFEQVTITGEVNLTKVGVYQLEIAGIYRGKLAEAELSVLVVDSKPPIFNTEDNKEIVVLENKPVNLDAKHHLINAYDNYDGMISDRISLVEAVDITESGDYFLTYQVSDTSGNTTNLEIKFRVVKDKYELVDYLYKATLDLYWGKFYLKNYQDPSIIENFFDIINYHFTKNYQTRFKQEIGLNGKLNPLKSPLHISYDQANNIVVQASNHEKVANYMYSKIKIISESSNYIKAQVTATYGKNQVIEKTVDSIFELRRVNGKWLVDNFTLPN